jgi:glycosyltransferase involved in cell wall biosynthesis
MTRQLRVLARPGRSAASFNPYTSLLVEALEATVEVEVVEFSPARLLRERFDIIHVHWPEQALGTGPYMKDAARAVAYLASLRLARRRGARLVWTGHDLGLHEMRWPRSTNWYLRRFMRLVDGVIALTEASRQPLTNRYPMLRTKPWVTIPHGHYVGVYAADFTQVEARRTLGLPDSGQFIALVGQLRPYKGADRLIDVFRQLNDPYARLLIAGSPLDDRLADDLRHRAAGDDRITLMLRRLTDTEITAAIRASDAVVVPFRHILHSGTVFLAWSLGRRVVATRADPLVEQAGHIDERWTRFVADHMDADDLAHALNALPGPTELPDLAPFDWGPIGAATAAFYRSLVVAKA